MSGPGQWSLPYFSSDVTARPVTLLKTMAPPLLAIRVGYAFIVGNTVW